MQISTATDCKLQYYQHLSNHPKREASKCWFYQWLNSVVVCHWKVLLCYYCARSAVWLVLSQFMTPYLTDFKRIELDLDVGLHVWLLSHSMLMHPCSLLYLPVAYKSTKYVGLFIGTGTSNCSYRFANFQILGMLIIWMSVVSWRSLIFYSTTECTGTYNKLNELPLQTVIEHFTLQRSIMTNVSLLP